MTKAFQVLDAGVTAVEKQKRTSAEFDFDKALDNYVVKAYDAFTEAMKAVQADSKSAKDTGAIKRLEVFEDTIRPQKVAVERMVERINRINVAVRDGRIALDPAEIKRATPEDLKDLSNWLTPKELERYRKIDPRITSSDVGCPVLRVAAADEQWAASCTMPRVFAQASGPRRAMDIFADLFVSRADASLGLACVGTCKASLGLGCFVCVASAPVAVKKQWDAYVSIRNSCGTCKWWKPWACACRAAAAVSFLAALA